MTRTEQNIKIAEALGFTRGRIVWNGRRVEPNWIYPEEWKHLQVSSPEHTLPDFVGMLEDAAAFSKQNYIRRDASTRLKTEWITPGR